MADISKITLPDNTTYNIKDNNARNFTNTPYYEQDEEALMFQLGESYMTGEQDNQPYLFRAAGGSAEIGNREYDKIVGGTVAWNQAVRDSASENETDFAPIVTVTDAVEDVAGVKVKIEPVQDLHGYDHPWPAGGGKNLIVPKDVSFTLNGISCVCSTSAETISLKGTATSNGGRTGKMTKDIVLPAGTYTLSVTAVSGIKKAQYIVNRTDNNAYVSEGSFLLEEATSIYVGVNVAEGMVYNEVVHIQIESGSTATEWAPYSNICPITGWTGAKVTRTGKNLFDTSIFTENGGVLQENGMYYFSNVMSLLGKVFYKNAGYIGQLVVTLERKTKVGEQSLRVIIIYTDGTRDKVGALFATGGVDTYTVVTASGKIVDRIIGDYGNNFSTYARLQIEFGTTATAYKPYQGQTYDIAFPTEAGTVYGGELTINADGSGSLVVDKAIVDLGTLDWIYNLATMGVFHSDGIRTIVKSNENCICSAYAKMKYPSATNIPNEADKTFAINKSSSGNAYTGNLYVGALIVKDNSYTSSTAFKAAVSGVQLVYELIAHLNYTLTPTEIRTFLGQNNVWADTGDLALTYTGTDEHLTLESGKKYLTRISGTDSMLLGSGQEITVEKGTNNVFDITQMFGTTIADYIYSLEQATPGAGIAWFRKLFPKPYYEYNAGELMSVQAVAHKLVGFNAWDEEWQLGIINTTTGEEIDSSSNIRSKNYIHVIPGATYYFKLGTTDISNNVVFYDAEKNYVAASDEHTNDTFTVPENAHYMKFYMSTNYGSTYLSNICINLSGNGERDGEYEEYNMHSYPLDSSLILRGIPKLDANNQLYYDGDEYQADGTVTRRYGIVDLGTLTWIYQKVYSRFYNSQNVAKASSRNVLCLKFPEKNNGINTNYVFIDNFGRIFIRTIDYTDAATFKAAMSGVYLVYELATPTIEAAEPYDNPQIVDPEGTEEYITTNIVFVGHETKY